MESVHEMKSVYDYYDIICPWLKPIGEQQFQNRGTQLRLYIKLKQKITVISIHTTSFETPYYDGRYSHCIRFIFHTPAEDPMTIRSVTNYTKADLLSLISSILLTGQRYALPDGTF